MESFVNRQVILFRPTRDLLSDQYDQRTFQGIVRQAASRYADRIRQKSCCVIQASTSSLFGQKIYRQYKAIPFPAFSREKSISINTFVDLRTTNFSAKEF